MSDEGTAPLLFDGEDSKSKDFDDSQRKRRNQSNRYLRISVGVNAALLVLCIILSLVAVRRRVFTIAEPYTPARSAIEYEYRQMDVFDPRFDGFPGPLWDESIHDLLNGTLIRISKDELDMLHESMPAAPIALEGGGFAAGLGVAHNLHCVKKLKEFLYLNHFFPNLKVSSEKFETVREHADHCLGFIRQSVLCNIDYSVYTLFWEGMDEIKSNNQQQND